MEDGNKQVVTNTKRKLEKLRTDAKARIIAIEQQLAEILHGGDNKGGQGDPGDTDAKSAFGSDSVSSMERGACSPGGQAAGSGTKQSGETGENNGSGEPECHCKHVDTLIFEVSVIRDRM